MRAGAVAPSIHFWARPTSHLVLPVPGGPHTTRSGGIPDLRSYLAIFARAPGNPENNMYPYVVSDEDRVRAIKRSAPPEQPEHPQVIDIQACSGVPASVRRKRIFICSLKKI